MAADTPPTIFGKYRILGRIAAGGMAEIYKARLDGLGGFQRTFAIKRVLPHLAQNAEAVEMLVDEAKIAGLLSHANIVQILDLGHVDDTYYIAMEYVDGLDLGRILKRCRQRATPLPLGEALFIACEVLKGLEYAHARTAVRDGAPLPLQIVHRDIQPGNLLVSLHGDVKIIDFGIAKASIKSLETLSGVIKGRFDYLSPEQASGTPVDARSDLFSLGVCLYEMLVGRNPFSRPREADTILAVREGRLFPPRELRPDLPPELEAILLRALQADPNKRYQSATEMKEALSAAAHALGLRPSPAALAAFLAEILPEEVASRLAEPAPTRREGRSTEARTGEIRATEARASRVAEPMVEARPPEPTPEPAPPGDWNDARTVIRTPPEPAAPPPPPAAPAHEGLSRWVGRAAIATAILLTGSGGFLAGVLVGASRSGAVDARPPRLYTQLPVGARLWIDGREADASQGLPLSAEEAHTVRVELTGRPAWEQELTLAAGESRWLVVP